MVRLGQWNGRKGIKITFTLGLALFFLRLFRLGCYIKTFRLTSWMERDGGPVAPITPTSHQAPRASQPLVDPVTEHRPLNEPR